MGSEVIHETLMDLIPIVGALILNFIFISINIPFFPLFAVISWHFTAVIHSLYQKMKKENEHQPIEDQNDPFEV